MIVTPRSSPPHSHRPPRSPRSPPAISYPLPLDYPPSTTAPVTAPVSSSPMPSHGHTRRPSVTNAMSWLTRTAANTSSKSVATPSKPVRISEPRFANSLDALTNPRSGPLGSGATIVKTPQEALSGTTVHLTHEGVDHSVEEEDDDESTYSEDDEMSVVLPASPGSPPLPPLPVSPTRTSMISQSAPDLPLRESVVSVQQKPPPIFIPAPSAPLKKPASPPPSTLPASLTASPPQQPFEAVLVSPVPACSFDAKIIVSLETDTITHRTTLGTLTSRPSHLSNYLTSLLPHNRDSDIGSDSGEAPTTPDFNSIFRNHLASSGLIAPSAFSIHIFLDRPSTPYAHLLAYLRTPVESPTVLPRSIQVLPLSARLEALLDLRDEARYLNFDELQTLCDDAISQIETPTRNSGQREPVRESTMTIHGVQAPLSPHNVNSPVDPNPPAGWI